MGEARGQTILALQQCFPTCASGKWGDSHMHDLFFWPLLHHTAASGAFLTPLKHFGGGFFQAGVFIFYTSSLSSDVSKLSHPFFSIDIKKQLRKH